MVLVVNDLSGKLLAELERLHSDWLHTQANTWACKEGCASCCTRSVTASALEARRILDYLSGQQRPWQGSPPLSEGSSTAAQQARPLTTNQLARFCLDGEEPPEPPTSPWDLAPCPFLTDNRCTIYPVRPFMCRAFVSLTPCSTSGEAVVPPVVLSGNTVFLQLIEHLGQGEPWGNMLQLLDRFAGLENSSQRELIRAEPLPGFLVEPEEQEMLNAIFAALSHTMVVGSSVWQWLQQGGYRGA